MHDISHYIEIFFFVMFVIWYANIQINKNFCFKFQKLIMNHNRFVSFDHSKKTTKRYKLIVNTKKRNIINSFVDSIEYFDRRISTIIDVTKIILSNVDSNSFYFDWQNVFTMIRLNHQIKFKSSRKHYIKIFEQWSNKIFVVESKIRFLIINIRNIFFVRKLARKHIYWFSSIYIIFEYFEWIQYHQYQDFRNFRSNFYFFDRFSIIYLFRKFFKILFISLTNRSFFSIHSINSIFCLEIFKVFHNIFSNNQHWNHFFYSKIDHKTYLLIITNRHFSFVTKIISIIESKNQSIFRQNFRYWQFHINIWIIVCFWKFSKITFVCLTNSFDFFNFDDDFNIQISKHFQFEIFLFWFKKWNILRNRKLFSTFLTMFVFILRIKFVE